VVAFVGVVAWATGAVAATFPGDAIDPGAAAAFAAGIAARALVAGSVAFALAPLLGRGASAGIAGALMLGGYIVHSYRTIVPAFDAVAGATWFSWTADHVPLAGRTDWAGIALAAVAAIALLAVGIEVFARRTSASRSRCLARSRLLLGVRPLGRSLSDLLPAALAGAPASRLRPAHGRRSGSCSTAPGVTGDGTSSGGSSRDRHHDNRWVPPAGVRRLRFVLIARGDDVHRGPVVRRDIGRPELQLTTPLTRARWAVATGIAACRRSPCHGLPAAAIGLGVASIGQDPVMPAAGRRPVRVRGAPRVGPGRGSAGSRDAGVLRSRRDLPARHSRADPAAPDGSSSR
jgi:hypothetical protein